MSRSLLDSSRRLGLEWRDPEPRRRPTQWEPLLALLRERPGVWAVIGRYANVKTANNTAGRLRRRYPEFDFEGRPSERGGELFGRVVPAKRSD